MRVVCKFFREDANMNQMFFSEDVSRLLRDSLREDIGTGDITTLSVIDRTRQGYGRYVAKEDGIL